MQTVGSSAVTVFDARDADVRLRFRPSTSCRCYRPCRAVAHGLDTGDEDLVRRAVAQLAAAGSRAS